MSTDLWLHSRLHCQIALDAFDEIIALMTQNFGYSLVTGHLISRFQNRHHLPEARPFDSAYRSEIFRYKVCDSRRYACGSLAVREQFLYLSNRQKTCFADLDLPLRCRWTRRLRGCGGELLVSVSRVVRRVRRVAGIADLGIAQTAAHMFVINNFSFVPTFKTKILPNRSSPF